MIDIVSVFNTIGKKLSLYSLKFPLTLLVWVLFLSACSETTSAADPGEVLFHTTDQTAEIALSEKPTIIRGRYVEVDIALLDDLAPGDTLALNLFDDVLLTAIIDQAESTQAGQMVIGGYVEAVDYSQFTLIVGGGQVAGNVLLPDAFYEVRYAGNQVHAVYQIDQSAFPREE